MMRSHPPAKLLISVVVCLTLLHPPIMYHQPLGSLSLVSPAVAEARRALVLSTGAHVMVMTHDRKHFYKYFRGDTAIRILDTLRVKWSSPRLFNDPFDVQVDVRFPFTPGEFLARMATEIERAIFAKDEPT